MAIVLVTRPADVAERTARTVRRLGHEALLAPVITIEPITGPPPSFQGVQAVLVTSRQAVPAVVGWHGRPPVYAVGAGTAAALHAAEVEVMGVGTGDGAALGRLLEEGLDPAAGALLHASGAVTAPGLEQTVRRAGFDYRVHPVYRAVGAEALPAHVEAALADGRIAAVTLHSPESARHLLALLDRAGLTSAIASMTALCLSPNVAVAAGSLPWRQVVVADRADERGMGALLEATAL